MALPDGAVNALQPSAIQALIDFLSLDDRPTFILQLHDTKSPSIVFTNPALERFLSTTPQDEFLTWTNTLLDLTGGDNGNHRLEHGGLEWQCKKLANHQCAVVYTEEQTTQREPPNAADTESYSSMIVATDTYDDRNPCHWLLDWTRNPSAALNPWIKRLIETDWKTKQIGPMHTWPDELRQALVRIFASGDPRILNWGEDALVFFNEAAVPIVGEQWEYLLGNSIIKLGNSQLVEMNREFLRTGLKDGKTVKIARQKYGWQRDGFGKDIYLDVCVVPICSQKGYFCAMCYEFVDVTATVLQDRRTELSMRLLERTTASEDLEQLWSELLNLFDESQSHMSYALLYTNHGSPAVDSFGTSPRRDHCFILKGAVGVVTDNIPSSIDIASSSPSELEKTFIQSAESNCASVLRLKDNTLPSQLHLKLSNNVTVDVACVLPLSNPSGKDLLAFLVLGNDPRQPFEKEDQRLATFVKDTVSKSATYLALPEHHRDKEKLAHIKQRMVDDLEALRTERNGAAFASLASDAPCGMTIIDSDGAPRYVNKKWLQMTGFSSLEQVRKINRTRPFWFDILSDKDRLSQEISGPDAVFSRNFTVGEAQRTEHRLLYPPDPSNPDAPRKFNRWVEAITLPEFDPANRVQGMMGFLIDISDRKKAEELRKLQVQQEQALSEQRYNQQLKEALANKVAAHNFIDTVSHELRNPLSAILQLTDDIFLSINSLPADVPETATVTAVTESLTTVVVCIQHMKTIVDDILTLSKLDSNLLTLSQDQARPVEMVAQALRMCEAEYRAAQIESCFEIDDSYHSLNINYVSLDRSRTLQVLLNLMSNAIKFTRSCDEKKITIGLAAAQTVPLSRGGTVFAEMDTSTDASQSSMTCRSPKGPGSDEEVIYLSFTVTDTGRGISAEEMSRLFQRFSQGSTKTYTEYGGSGLGLFISKRLVELQHGQVGVKSDGLGCGSTFSFYVRVKRICAPSTASPATMSFREPTLVNVNGDFNSSQNQLHSTPSVDEKGQLHILIVEDNAINQKVMAKQLRKLEHIVYVASHGLEALGFLKRTHFCQREATNASERDNVGPVKLSVILMDIEMLIMNGLDCTRKIREMQTAGEITQHVPILAITANARSEQVNQALEIGVDGVVTKPFRIPSLMSAIADLLSKHPN